MTLLLLAKNGRITNWFGLFCFQNPVKGTTSVIINANSKLIWKDELYVVLGRNILQPPVHIFCGKILQTIYFFYIQKNLAIIKIPNLQVLYFSWAAFPMKKLSDVALLFIFQNRYERLQLDQITILKKLSRTR